MSKLFKLKEWLTVPEAAGHLSGVFEEEVTEADVLRLALDKHLRLSVNFVNGTSAKPGKVISWSETQWMLGLPIEGRNTWGERVEENGSLKIGECPTSLASLYEETPDDIKQATSPICKSLWIGDHRFVDIDNEKIVTLWKVWDLPMIGSERLDIEHAYQQLTGGPSLTVETLDGAFVEGSDGMVLQLQTDFDDNEYQPGSSASLERLKNHIANKKIKKKEADSLLNAHREKQREFKEGRKSQPAWKNYFPAGGLPSDSVLVVRTEALREFEKAISGQPTTAVRDESLLAVIAALLAQWPNGKHPTGKDLEKAAQSIGIKVSDDTIRKALKAARDIAPGLSA